MVSEAGRPGAGGGSWFALQEPRPGGDSWGLSGAAGLAGLWSPSENRQSER